MNCYNKLFFSIDTHVHIYPQYDLKHFFDSAYLNLGRIASSSNGDSSIIIRILCLTERASEDYFESFRKDPSKLEDSGLKIHFFDDQITAKLSNHSGESIYLLRGYQIVSSEGLEVLSLATDYRVKDGNSINHIIQEINSGKGAPVLPWSPGKWLGRRGQLIKTLFEESSTNDFYVGDISMRATFTPANSNLKLARTRKFKIIAGSDPLPYHGEEQQIGRHGLLFENKEDQFSESDLARYFLVKLKSDEFDIIGKRNSLYSASKRWFQANILRAL